MYLFISTWKINKNKSFLTSKGTFNYLTNFHYFIFLRSVLHKIKFMNLWNSKYNVKGLKLNIKKHTIKLSCNSFFIRVQNITLEIFYFSIMGTLEEVTLFHSSRLYFSSVSKTFPFFNIKLFNAENLHLVKTFIFIFFPYSLTLPTTHESIF